MVDNMRITEEKRIEMYEKVKKFCKEVLNIDVECITEDTMPTVSRVNDKFIIKMPPKLNFEQFVRSLLHEVGHIYAYVNGFPISYEAYILRNGKLEEAPFHYTFMYDVRVYYMYYVEYLAEAYIGYLNEQIELVRSLDDIRHELLNVVKSNVIYFEELFPDIYWSPDISLKPLWVVGRYGITTAYVISEILNKYLPNVVKRYVKRRLARLVIDFLSTGAVLPPSDDIELTAQILARQIRDMTPAMVQFKQVGRFKVLVIHFVE